MPGNNVDRPITDSDAIFARAYGAALKPLLGVSGDVGKHQLILTSPPTQRGIAAGSDIDSKYTGYLIYKFADALQDSDNPVLGGSDVESYVGQLATYASWVWTNDGYASEQNKRWLKEAQKALAEAAVKSREIEKTAHKDWEEAKSGMEFEQWANLNYPELRQAREEVQRAEFDLQMAEEAIDGPKGTLLKEYRRRLDNAQSQQGALPDYNQQVIPRLEQPKATIYVPLYSIGTYGQAVEQWHKVTKGIPPEKVKRNQVVTFSINEGRKTSWDDYGFKEVRVGGNVGFWPLFYADVNVRGTTERRELNTNGLESKIDLTLAMVGAIKFDINAGLWDAPDIKTVFPELRTGAPKDILGPKFARVTSVLVGYNVQLVVDFGAELIEEVNKIYEEVKQKGGSLTIFGIRVSVEAGGGSVEGDEYRFKGIKWNKTTGFLSITPSTGQPTPTFLGAIARRFD